MNSFSAFSEDKKDKKKKSKKDKSPKNGSDGSDAAADVEELSIASGDAVDDDAAMGKCRLKYVSVYIYLFMRLLTCGPSFRLTHSK